MGIFFRVSRNKVCVSWYFICYFLVEENKVKNEFYFEKERKCDYSKYENDMNIIFILLLFLEVENKVLIFIV